MPQHWEHDRYNQAQQQNYNSYGGGRYGQMNNYGNEDYGGYDTRGNQNSRNQQGGQYGNQSNKHQNNRPTEDYYGYDDGDSEDTKHYRKVYGTDNYNRTNTHSGKQHAKTPYDSQNTTNYDISSQSSQYQSTRGGYHQGHQDYVKRESGNQVLGQQVGFGGHNEKKMNPNIDSNRVPVHSFQDKTAHVTKGVSNVPVTSSGKANLGVARLGTDTSTPNTNNFSNNHINQTIYIQHQNQVPVTHTPSQAEVTPTNSPQITPVAGIPGATINPTHFGYGNVAAANPLLLANMQQQYLQQYQMQQAYMQQMALYQQYQMAAMQQAALVQQQEEEEEEEDEMDPTMMAQFMMAMMTQPELMQNPSLLEKAVGSLGQMLNTNQPDDDEMFNTECESCPCCKGFINSCSGDMCKTLGVCHCMLRKEKEEENTTKGAIFHSEKANCACCKGFIYACKGVACVSEGQCQCVEDE